MKKLFTLLTLLVFLGGGKSWGQDEIIFKMVANVTSDQKISKWSSGDPVELDLSSYADITPTGSTAVAISRKNSEQTIVKNQDSGDVFNFGTNDVGIKITFTEALKKGDVITAENASNQICFTKTATRSSTIQTSSGSFTIPEGSDLIGATTLYIWRSTSSGTTFKSLTISRPAIDYASPAIDTDLSTTPVDVDVNIGTTLSIEASHVTGYQWYRNTAASTTGAEAIDGATAAAYSYTAPAADAETTVYFYCVVTNDNATGTKTATSAFAQVNVGAVPTLTAVSKQIWNIGDFVNTTYSIATIVNNLEICNGTIDDGSKNIDGFTLSKRIKINKDVEGTSRYIKFKVGGPCVITVYGMTGSSSKTRKLGIMIGGTDVAELSHSGSDMGKISYTYTGSETDVILHTTDGDGTFNVHGITVSDIDFTMNAYGWATYVAEDNIVLVDGLEAYAITGATNSSIVKSDPLTTIKAGVPVLLKGEASTKYYLPLAGSNAATPSGNLLRAGDGSEITAVPGKTRYVLSVESEKATFLKIASIPAIVPTGKAYLEFNEVIGDAREFLDIDIDGVSTGIKNMKVGSEDNVYYDLQGRRVLYPTKGLYIVNC